MAPTRRGVRPLPTGMVTFLFTDIEGSTRLWEQFPAEMGTALTRHDELLREAIDRHDGAIFATGGDAFCAAFQTASHALSAAHAAQHALARETWPQPLRLKVRMALHTGAAELRGEDYFGPPLNRVGRLLAAGHGGQVLLSLATQELLPDALPGGLSLRDMGERRLKDLIRPERVYQLVGPELASEFPPLRTLDARAHNLPIHLTSFVGREREMGDLKALLRDSRLLTLTGAGGAGKTRLALQVAAEVVDDYADGVWLVELASLTDPTLVPHTVASVLGVREDPAVPMTATLQRHLNAKELLLLLDNCEHLVLACSSLCQALLSSCVKLRILATSRETLRIAGETACRVPSLAQNAAVELFIDRARAVKPAFRVDDANASVAADICDRLDGMPLAVELAAAALRTMSVKELNQRLDQRFQLLTRGARTALPRQQTLRALIDWSHDLLSPGEQALFRRLAVFAGGFALDAVEKICSADDRDEGFVFDHLAALADKSLISAEEGAPTTRYSMLETVRQYAHDRLVEAGDADRWRDAHLAYFRALAEEIEPQLTGAAQNEGFDRLEGEHENLRMALDWSAGAPARCDSGLRLAGALWHFFQVRGYQREGRDRLASLLAMCANDQASPTRAKALSAAGNLAWVQGDYAAARSYLHQSLEVRRSLDDRLGIARTLGNLGNVAREQGDYETARRLQEESLEVRRPLGDTWGVAATLCNLGLVAYDQGDYALARSAQEEALSTFRQLGDRRSIAGTSNNLGEVASAQGDHEAASRHYREGLAIFRGLGDRRGIAITLTGLGGAVAAQGDVPAARALHAESLTLKVEAGDRRGIAISLEALAHIDSLCGAYAQAALLWGAAERMREEIEAPRPLTEQGDYDRQVAAARAAMNDTTAFERAWQDGRAMPLEQAIDAALKAR